MTVYLDTNICVWLVRADLSRLTVAARDLLNSADQLLISPAVLLELEYLFEINRLRIGSNDMFLKLQSELGVAVCNLEFPKIMAVAVAEKWTRDPFDRLIVAQAKANGLSYLVTADEKIKEAYVRAVC